MKVRIRPTLLVVALCLFGTTALAGGKDTGTSAARFETLKSLVGDWVPVDKEGKGNGAIASSIRLTGAGSVVQETLFPGTEHEMVTMYHLDGADLVLTHYCAVGNQPKMRAVPGDKAGRIEFKFVGGTNLTPSGIHMDHATLTILSKDRFQAEWTACKEGKECHKASFDLVRKKP